MREKVALMLMTAVGICYSQVPIYRSIKPGTADTLFITSGASISNDTLYLDIPAPDTIGVGVVYQYLNNTNLAFVHKRVSATVWLVKDSLGGTTYLNQVSNDGVSYFFHCYTSLAGFNSGVENTIVAASLRNWPGGNRNIQSANEDWFVPCYAGRDSVGALINIANWNTSPTHRIRIYAPMLSSEVGLSQRHKGKYDDYGYKLFRNSSSAGDLLQISNGSVQTTAHVDFDGISFKTMGTGAKSALVFQDPEYNSVDNINISNCIMVGSDSSSTQTNHQAIRESGGGLTPTINVWNTIVYGFKSTASGDLGMTSTGGSGAIWKVSNCTLFDCETGIVANGITNFTVYNTIVNSTSNGFSGSKCVGDYNVSSIAADAPGTHSVNCSVAFTNATNGDFSLSILDTCARDNGTDLSAGTPPVAEDITGTARPQNVIYDVGAFEYVETVDENGMSWPVRRRGEARRGER